MERFEGATGRPNIPSPENSSVDDSLSSYANVLSCFRVCSPRAIDGCAQHVSRANEELAIDSLLVTDGLFRSRCAVCMAWHGIYCIYQYAYFFCRNKLVKAPSLSPFCCIYPFIAGSFLGAAIGGNLPGHEMAMYLYYRLCMLRLVLRGAP